MRTKPAIRIAAPVLGLLFAITALVFFSGPPEPVYQGKPLRQWIAIYTQYSPNPVASPTFATGGDEEL